MKKALVVVMSAASLIVISGARTASSDTKTIKTKVPVPCEVYSVRSVRSGPDVCIRDSPTDVECKSKFLADYYPQKQTGKDPCVKYANPTDSSKWNYDYKDCTTKVAGATAKIVVDYHPDKSDACVISIPYPSRPCSPGWTFIEDLGGGKDDYCVLYN